MKFVYGYKTKKNETRYDSISASSRDEVYRLLKVKGIRPFKVELATGFINRLQSVGKRTYAIVVLVALVAVGVVVNFSLTNKINQLEVTGETPLPRHQIYGDPALMDEIERSGYSTVFTNSGDCVLAHFAQPGQIVRFSVSRDVIVASLADAVPFLSTTTISFSESDSREVRELKRIVLGMREEFKRYLSNGIGTPDRYLRRLMQRQERESAIYHRAKFDLEQPANTSRWDSINASLRAVGLKTIPKPESVSEAE